MDYNIYPDYQNQCKILRGLAADNKLRLLNIGKSLCGRTIYAAKIGHGNPFALIAGGFHGTEYLTVLAALRYAAEYDLPRCVMIVPCVNPDGTEIAINGFSSVGCCADTARRICPDKNRWKANARGVDINHNFNACWREVKRRELDAGITKPACTRFGGLRPESEPETRAMVRMCRRFPFERVLALHSQGREIYWNFKNCAPKNGYELAKKMSLASGYELTEPETIADGGGFKDWFLKEFRREGFTAEIGLGENPLPLSDFGAEYPLVKKMIDAFLG